MSCDQGRRAATDFACSGEDSVGAAEERTDCQGERLGTVPAGGGAAPAAVEDDQAGQVGRGELVEGQVAGSRLASAPGRSAMPLM